MTENRYEYFYHIETATLEEICEEHNPGFPFFAAPCDPSSFAGNAYPWHWHSYVHFFFVESGEISYQTQNGTYCFKEGEGGLINANVLHRMYAAPGRKNRYIELLLHPSVVGGAADNDIMRKYVQAITENAGFDLFSITREMPACEEMIGLLRETWQIYTDREECYELCVRSKLSLLWALMFRLSAGQRAKAHERQSSGRLKAMLHFIREHASEKLSLEEIARAGTCSRRECSRVFQAELHTTPFQYLQEVRLNKASEMLINTDASITEISELCGFSDPSHFTKAFKSRSGMTPRQFRQRSGRE